MKIKTTFILIFSLALLLISSVPVFSWGPITHMTILEEIINDPTLDPNVKKILQENLRYAKGGAIGPDLFYFSKGRYSDIVHYCSAGQLAKTMLDMAKKDGDPKKIAFAYGWMIHVASDAQGHRWVNRVVENELGLPSGEGAYDESNSAIKSAHRNIELSIDKKNYLNHATETNYYDPETGAEVTLYQYNSDIDVPNRFLSKVYEKAYGCKGNSPNAFSTGEVAENIAQAVFNGEPAYIMFKDAEKYNTEEYNATYVDSINDAIAALNSAGTSLKDKIDLDTGLAFGDRGYAGDQKEGVRVKPSKII